MTGGLAKNCTKCGCRKSDHEMQRFQQKDAMYFQCNHCVAMCHEFGRDLAFTKNAVDIWNELNGEHDQVAAALKAFAEAPRTETKRITCEKHRTGQGTCACMW